MFQATISPLLFLAAMGLGLGDLVNKGSGGVDGVDYLVFVTPGPDGRQRHDAGARGSRSGRCSAA